MRFKPINLYMKTVKYHNWTTLNDMVMRIRASPDWGPPVLVELR